MAGATGTLLEERRESLRALAAPSVNGIDRIEVVPGAARTVLKVYLVHPAPGQPGGVPASASALDADDIRIEGGDRRRGLRAVSATSAGREVTVEVDRAGDFSTYHLVLDHPDMDPVLGRAAFGFRADCPEGFDPCTAPEPAPEGAGRDLLPARASTYLARDYEAFRRVMLDRMSVQSPGWSEPAVPDAMLSTVELMAHYADLLSYRQDVVAGEAYLDTARLRTSLARHAALLGYRPMDGASARVFVHLEADGVADLAPGDVKVLTDHPSLDDEVTDPITVDVAALVATGAQVFEPVPVEYVPADYETGSTDTQRVVRPIRIKPAHNAVPVHDWGDERAVLARGATQAWVRAASNALELQRGDVVLFEQVRDPATLRPEDSDPALRQLVQLVADPEFARDEIPADGGASIQLARLRWHPADALRFDLPVGYRVVDGVRKPLAVLRGNMVLCDHGTVLAPLGGTGEETLVSPPDSLDQGAVSGITSLAQLDPARGWRPRLRTPSPALRTHIRLASAPEGVEAILSREGRETLPDIALRESVSGREWHPVPSLLEAGDAEAAFVPETEADGSTFLRFAKPGSVGLEVPPATEFEVRVRSGRGPQGNVGAETLVRALAVPSVPIRRVRNPLPAFGGALPESAESLKANAVAGLSRPARAVTAEDHARRAASHPLVAAAHARTIWHGSWNTLVIAVDLEGGAELTDAVRNGIEAHIEPWRLMGQDIRVEAPRLAPLDVVAHVCVAPGHREGDVFAAVEDALSARRLRDGTLGFFHPDRRTFGDPVWLSRIYEAVYAVAGVADVRITRLARWDRPGEDFVEAGVLRVGIGEIASLDNDPNRPGRGRLAVRRWV